MVSDSTSSKTPLFLVLGLVIVISAFVVGVVVCFTVMATQKTWMAYFSPPPVIKHSGIAEKAQLPDDMWDTAQQAADYFKKQQFDEAAACYQQIIDKYPDCLYAWSNLGVIRYHQGNFDQAKAALLKAVAFSPDDAFSWANLGLAYYQLKQYSDAVGALEKAVELNPGDALSHNYLGCCYAKIENTEKAKKEYKRAIELNPKFGDAYFNLALLYATATPPEIGQARIYYQQARDLGIDRDMRLEKIIAGGDVAK